jgi:hypothetical protein
LQVCQVRALQPNRLNEARLNEARLNQIDTPDCNTHIATLMETKRK